MRLNLPIQRRRRPLTSRRGKPDRAGAVAVEMAVVSPLLALLFIGMCEFGSILYSRHTIVVAAREGARQMAIEGATEQEAETVVKDYLSGFGLDGATISTTNAYKGNGDSAEARRVTVRVSMKVGDASLLKDPLGVFSTSEDIVAEVSMRKEGELVSAP